MPALAGLDQVKLSPSRRLRALRTGTPTKRRGTNPEQLVAAGWSSCFESATNLAARKEKIILPADVAIDADVDLHPGDRGYFLRVHLNICLQGIERVGP